jgi:DNA (cytosine-5)-methyltransferase 1
MRVLELFAGAGGAALGLQDAGFEHIACVERDPSAVATLRAAGFPAVEADVRNVDYDAMAGTIDLLWASPPCQAWSGLGQRQGARDRERNGWPWTLDILERVRPTWAVMENVPGMLAHPYLTTVVLPRLRRLFEHVDARVLNAADFGLPQARRRLFIVAGPGSFVWPRASHGPEAARPHVSVRDALRLGPEVVAMAHECNAGWGLARVPVSLDQPAPTLRARLKTSPLHGAPV